MARKSNRDDLSPVGCPKPNTAIADPGRQPRIVGWLVLIVGAFSSWYWYRPLPDSVHQTIHATNTASWATTKSGPNSLWTEQTLILPNTDSPTSTSNEFRSTEMSSDSGDDSKLVGTPKVTLVPWSEVHHDIRDVLKTERVPMVPISPTFNEGARTFSPQVWTPDQQLSSRMSDSTQLKSKWPDSGYVAPQKLQKEQRRSASQITTQIPKLLETGMKSIRPEEPLRSPSPAIASQPDKPDIALPQPAQPTRQPQFIRQPPSSN